MLEAIFTSQIKNKEKIDRRCWQQGHPIRKYQMRVLKSMSKIWQGCPIPKYQMPTIVEWAGFSISSDIDMAPRAK